MLFVSAMKVRSLGFVSLLVLLAGCAGLEYAPKGGMLYFHRELPAADRAVEAARRAGKATQCPAAFAEAEKLRDDAYTAYWSCRTAEAIDLANKAVARANGLCPVVQQVPPPAPAAPVVPPPPPAPTASIAAEPASIQAGQCTILKWSSTNAASASIEPGLGAVAPSGSQQVCPPSTTQYTIAARGADRSAAASTTVAVTTPPPPPPAPAAPPAPKVVDRLTVRVNFDTDAAVIRPADRAELQRAIDFVKRYPGYRVSIEGHTDDRGSATYNQRLSERRAAAVKDYLIKNGAGEGSRMTAVGHGKSRPIATNATAAGRFENRRVEIVVISE